MRDNAVGDKKIDPPHSGRNFIFCDLFTLRPSIAANARQRFVNLGGPSEQGKGFPFRRRRAALRLFVICLVDAPGGFVH